MRECMLLRCPTGMLTFFISELQELIRTCTIEP